MLKNILAGIAGIIAALITIMAIEWIGHVVYPPPTDLDMSDTEALARHIAAAPVGALLSVVLAYALGAFIGTTVACRIGTTDPRVFAAAVGGLVVVGTIMNLMMIPHPQWFAIAAFSGIAAAAFLAVKLSMPDIKEDAAP